MGALLGRQAANELVGALQSMDETNRTLSKLNRVLTPGEDRGRVTVMCTGVKNRTRRVEEQLEVGLHEQ